MKASRRGLALTEFIIAFALTALAAIAAIGAIGMMRVNSADIPSLFGASSDSLAGSEETSLEGSKTLDKKKLKTFARNSRCSSTGVCVAF